MTSHLHIRLLGTAAGGGLPQWNCACAGCEAARRGEIPENGQFSMALSVNGADWLLINASPDLREQLLGVPELHPKALRHSPIKAVLLTNGEIDAVAGLLSMREGQAFDLWADPAVHEVLHTSSVFDVLRAVTRKPLPQDTWVEPLAGLRLRTFAVPGKPAWYLEETKEADPGDTIGLEVLAAGKRVVILPACAEFTDALRSLCDGADALFLDGTLWQDDEMIRAGLAQKTGARMGHISVSGAEGALARTEGLALGQKIFVHINNSNPILLPATAERRAVEAAGWQIGQAGQIVTL